MLRLAGTLSYYLSILVTKILVCQGGCNEACIETQPSGVAPAGRTGTWSRDERSDNLLSRSGRSKAGLECNRYPLPRFDIASGVIRGDGRRPGPGDRLNHGCRHGDS